MMHRFLALIALLLLPVAASAQGVVSSADPRASTAGQEILRKGGSATDAAMAMLLALTVVEPQSSGIGGGGFLLHHDGRTGLVDTIDGRETAPSSASTRQFLSADGQALSLFQAIPGGKSVGIPGNVALMAKAHAKWGRLKWADLFTPAIRLAHDGFVVSRPLAAALNRTATLWQNFPAARQIYWQNGRPAPEGAVLTNPALAAFLEKLAAEGPAAFYNGENARAISDAVANTSHNASSITPEEISTYAAKDRPAVCSHYRVWTLCGMGPPSSGATTVFQILGMLEAFDMRKLGKDDPRSWHLIAEAMQLAYADRSKYLGDRDFVDVPVAGLLDPAYMKRRAALISPKQALEKYEAGTPPGATPRRDFPSPDVPGTTHFVAIDATGAIATMTSTIEGPFGSQLVANGYMLNNELTDFSFVPEKDGAPVANRVQPGKRPLSSMSPTIVYDMNGKPVFTIGAAGGKTIIMQVAKALIAHIDWGLSARDSIGLGLVYFNSEGLILEAGSSAETLKAPLEALGHTVSIAPMALKANAAERTSQGWVGAADPRSVGVALAQ